MYLRLRQFTMMIVALPLFACTTPAERELQRMAAASERLWVDYDACVAQSETSPSYQRLVQVFILKRDDPRSVEKMAINRYANDQEKADLIANQKEKTVCNQMLFNGFSQVQPGFASLIAKFNSQDNELILQTIQNEVTIGERNRAFQERFSERLLEWTAVGERITRFYTFNLYRRCSIYCSSQYTTSVFSGASLLPASDGSTSDLAEAAREASAEASLPTVPPMTDSAMNLLHKHHDRSPLRQGRDEPAIGPELSQSVQGSLSE